MATTKARFDDFKVGDTVSLAGTALLPDGDWVTNQPTGWLVDAAGAKVADLAIILEALGSPTADATHTISVELSATDSLALAAGPYRTDIRFFELAGTVMHTPTFVIELRAAMTGVP
jgi:hypothetical protein